MFDIAPNFNFKAIEDNILFLVLLYLLYLYETQTSIWNTNIYLLYLYETQTYRYLHKYKYK